MTIGMFRVLFGDYYLFIKCYSEGLIYVQELQDLNMNHVNVERREILDMSLLNFTCIWKKYFIQLNQTPTVPMISPKVPVSKPY